MQNDERNFRSSYYEKVGFRSVEEKKSIEILFKDKQLDKNKISQFCLRFTVPVVYRNLVWKLLLDVIPVYKDCHEFVMKERHTEYNDLLSSLHKMRLVTSETPKAKVIVGMWLLRTGNLKLDWNLQMESELHNGLFLISQSLLKIFDNDVDVYWISKGIFGCMMVWRDTIQTSVENTIMLLKKEDSSLYSHLTSIDALHSIPFERWFCSCFAGTIHESALVKIWDKLVGGSYKILIFVSVILLTSLRRVILKCQTATEVLSSVTTISEESAEVIASKAIDLWQQHGRSVTPSPGKEPKPHLQLRRGKSLGIH